MGLDPDSVVKLASNESPLPPFPEVAEVIAQAATKVNRYPDNQCSELGRAVAGHLGIPQQNLLFGGGSSEILRVISLAVGGPATSAVYFWPSFVIYRIAPLLAGSEVVEVPLGPNHELDADALTDAIRTDTTVVFLANPNNPTGTHLRHREVSRLVERLPERILLVIDEAYVEYVTAPDYKTALHEALDHSNVVVTRTFSKIFGLAGLRVGYAVGDAETLDNLRRAQAPFTVGSLSQLAAIEGLKYPSRVDERRRLNTDERTRLEKELEAREIEYVPSQANFIYLLPRDDRAPTFEQFLATGIIVREMEDGYIRVTVGLPEENDKFLTVLDQIRQ